MEGMRLEQSESRAAGYSELQGTRSCSGPILYLLKASERGRIDLRSRSRWGRLCTPEPQFPHVTPSILPENASPSALRGRGITQKVWLGPLGGQS